MEVVNHMMKKKKKWAVKKGKEVMVFVGICVLCYWISCFCFLEFMPTLNLYLIVMTQSSLLKDVDMFSLTF